jgi:multiple sugar transport system permease protein
MSRRRRPRFPRAPWLFLAPALAGGVLFYAVPAAISLALSFTDWNPLTVPRWSGLRNYRYLLTQDPLFPASVLDTVVFALGGALLGIPVALLLALLIERSRHPGFWRVIYWLPAVTSVVAIADTWRIVLDPSYGLLNRLLGALGLGGPAWLASPGTAMASVVAITIWAGLGHNILLFSAGLAGIDGSIAEAARLDGANAWQVFRHVTLPLLRPTLLFVAVTGLIAGMGSFALILALTGGGPERSTEVTALYMYQTAFEALRMGRAAAIAVILVLLVLAMAWLQARLLRSGDDDALA